MTHNSSKEEEQNKKSALSFSDTINSSFEIYKKTAFVAGLAFMFLMGIIFLFSIIGISFFSTPEKFAVFIKNFNPDKLPINQMLIYYSSIIGITVLIAPFIAGMLKIAHDADKDKLLKFSSIYYYINSSKFTDIILLTITVSFLTIGSSLFFKYILPTNLGEILGFIISYSFTILSYISVPLILFNNLNFIDAIKVSVSKIAPNFILVLLLMIIGGLFSVVGIMAFFIGMFFTIPFAYSIQYSIYKQLA